MMSTQSAIVARKISKQYGASRVLKEVSFELEQGGFLAIFGANGAGKTSLLRILATLNRPSQGSVSILGMDARNQSEEIRACVGLVTHNPMLYLDLSAADNLCLFARLYGVPQPEARAKELLEAVELSYRSNDTVREFSRGMIQRMAIARGIVHNPRILLLDEPYSGLDARSARIVDRLIGSDSHRRTVVMVSHDIAKGYQLCTHALVLAKGNMVGFEDVRRLTATVTDRPNAKENIGSDEYNYAAFRLRYADYLGSYTGAEAAR